jgi:hypothetical protein
LVYYVIEVYLDCIQHKTSGESIEFTIINILLGFLILLPLIYSNFRFGYSAAIGTLNTDRFLIGIGIGVIFTCLCVQYLALFGTRLTSNPKVFGDVKIWAQKPNVVSNEQVPEGFFQKCAEELCMTKHDKPFLRIGRNENEEIGALYLVKDACSPVLFMTSAENGKWKDATYSKDVGGRPVGDIFVDIDFDGQFDVKLVVNQESKCVSRSIRIDDSWHEVDKLNREQRIAKINETIYCFDPNIGCWLQH